MRTSRPRRNGKTSSSRRGLLDIYDQTMSAYIDTALKFWGFKW
jgi:hypothetical protein